MDSLQEFIERLTKTNITVKVTDIMDIKRYFLGLYHRYLVEMYDCNYTSDPTIFDLKEVYQILDDLCIDGLMDELGMIDLSFESVDFIKDYYKVKFLEEEEALEYLELLSKAIYYREISQNLDRFYDSGITKSGGKKKIELKCHFEDSVLKYTNPYGYDEGIQSCLLGVGVPVSSYSMLDKVMGLMEEQQGITELELIKGFSREQTVKHLPKIMAERVPLDGKDGNIIHEKNKTIRDKGFVTDNYFTKFMETEEDSIRGLYNDYLKKHKNILYGYGWNLYTTTKQKKAKIPYPIGFYTFAQYDITTGVSMAQQWYHNQWMDTEDCEGLLPEKNSILGYSGQVYSKDYLEHNQLDYVGCPIRLFNHEGVLEEFVDFEQTELAENATMFKEYEATLDFDGTKPANPHKKYTGWNKKVVDLYRDKETGVFDTTIEISPNGFELSELAKLADKVEEDLGLERKNTDAD